MTDTTQPDSAVAFDETPAVEVSHIVQTDSTPEMLCVDVALTDAFMFEGVVSPTMVVSDSVDSPLSFDVLSGFVSRAGDVLTSSYMDMSLFEYFSFSHVDDVPSFTRCSPTSHVYDIDGEFMQHDLDEDTSSIPDHSPTGQRVSPTTGDTKIVDFSTTDQPRELKFGSGLSTDERVRFIQLLGSYLDVFAWSYKDMPSLDPAIVQHRLPLLPHVRPVKQKLRRLHPKWSLKVKEEIHKQLSVGFLLVVEYPEWLANVVPVPKNDGKVRVCVDFQDLNKASPKDDFPLPHMDLLVDSTAGHPMLSFMDGFSQYNQNLMAPEDMEKTAFITEWGTYCYRVMPFGLKNAGATYQRAATTLFHDMMHRDVEVYVDDMIVKSWNRADHLVALQRFFDRIRQFRLRLNPKKCTFGVTSGKLLGHMVS